MATSQGSMRRRHSFLKRSWYGWCYDLTNTSRSLFIGGFVALFIGGYHTTDINTFILLGFYGVFGWLTLWITSFSRPNAALTHTLSPRAVSQETLPFSVQVKNLSSRPIRDLLLHAPVPENFLSITPNEAFLPILAPGEEKTLFFQASFHQRGSYYFRGWRADSTFPFGFYRLGRGRKQGQAVVIYPHFYPLESLAIPIGRRYHQGGLALVSEVGESMEYMGNREYQEGDDLRDVDWGSWARLGKPVVREFQEEYFCRVALVLDTQITSRSKKQRQNFEAALSLAASVADFLSSQEHIIDLFAAGPEIYLLESGRALAHMEQVLEILACLEPTKADPFEEVEPALAEKLPVLTSAIVILLQIDAQRLELIQKIQEYEIGVKVIYCGPPTTIPPDIVPVSPEQIRNGEVAHL